MPEAQHRRLTPRPRELYAGNEHTGLGTRNALLGLADGRYLEIIAPDPDQPPSGGFAAALAELAWELLFPFKHDFGALMPFFIDWGGGAHPADDLQPAGTLEAFTVESPATMGMRFG